ncbi:dual serine/threonine and tyrosine protein kinase-like isoform X2 [Hydractinia symbiolongicarpus]|uniref:dual serine/threonine and tyrosine protein kinase-like isoform X2 n=1 Tax=Hydractinia symbiolongicarpus TaxID=13093 RepID=UPI00254FC9B3|nr:dual serine/threonine and tyrosine protein kinase-like isoform X2 [Hydractinia symbiolongicarpus]
MAANLPYELLKFKEHTKLLKQVKRETDKAFHEIQHSGHFAPDMLRAYLLPEDEYHELAHICEKPPTIIVLGTSCYAKVCAINELVGEPILPLVEEGDHSVMWRMVRFKHGYYSTLSLVLPDSFELAAALDAYEGTWRSVPRADLELRGRDKSDPALTSAVAEVCLDHPLLKTGAEIICAPSNSENCVEQVFKSCVEDVLPIIIFAVDTETLCQNDINELAQINSFAMNCLPVFFIKVPPRCQHELTESLQDAAKQAASAASDIPSLLYEQLTELGFINKESKLTDDLPAAESQLVSSRSIIESVRPKSSLIEDFSLFPCFLMFVRQVLQYHIIAAACVLNDAHTRCLGMFINSAFDMARDISITPKRISYARAKEEELFRSLMDIANKKQEEIKEVIHGTVETLSPRLQEEAAFLKIQNVEFKENNELVDLEELERCTHQVQELVLSRLNQAVAGKLISSVEYLKESYVGTLTRCLSSLEKADAEFARDSSGIASVALKQVLDAAYQVEVTVQASFTLTRLLWEKLKQAVQMLPGKSSPVIDGDWKRKVAAEVIRCISESRLAKNICSQFKTRLMRSHEAFTQSLRVLEMRHNGRLEKKEEQRVRLRKVFAPRVARCVLDSTSLRDLVLYGMPQLGREIGRGQYGVVYACDKWGGRGPCAIKSVVPPDDKHWNDLALEFYYTRAIPEHERLVQIRGSVIDYSYAGGSSPAVLLVMDRMQRDLYAGIKCGMSFRSRLQVALDVVEGLRYLHSQGLIHRDIKLKNVLLDSKLRGKLTDLGFCKPGAMISGSIVGTPIHMAPELFSGRYDHSVDVYAFGILFWYICAGSVRLPSSYEQCASKDQLWNSVRKGVRPERLTHFDDECWNLMEQCWSGDSPARPLLGDIHPRLKAIKERIEIRDAQKRQSRPSSRPRSSHIQGQTYISSKHVMQIPLGTAPTLKKHT